MNPFQLQVLGLICEGQINKQIADTLNVLIGLILHRKNR